MTYDAWKTRDDTPLDEAPPEEIVECVDCGGEGSWEESAPSWDDPYGAIVRQCRDCGGHGYFVEEKRDDKQMAAGGLDIAFMQYALGLTDEELEEWLHG